MSEQSNQDIKTVQPKEKKPVYKKWWFILIAVMVMGRFCTAITNNNKKSNNIEQQVNSSLPTEEQEFIKIIQLAQNKNKEASNDMQRGGIRLEREKSICNLIKKGIKGWTGKIHEINANSDGLGILIIELADDIKLGTSNNEFSDSTTHTLIHPNSEIFKTVSSMSKGQKIKFDGDFFVADDGGCIRETSLTLEGKLESPDFLFRFSKVEKL